MKYPHYFQYLMPLLQHLFSNAVKYGIFSDVNSISYSITIYDDSIITEVKNPINTEKDYIYEKLDDIIQWIRGFHNPFEAYIEKLKEVSGKSMNNNENNLGLVRIAYEGQSILDFYINEENIISVSAVYMLQS